MSDDDAITSAEDCATMEEVRREIDRLDRRLVKLCAERQAYISAAARIKPDAALVRLSWRIDDVLSKVLQEAEAQGLSKRIEEPVWRELIERSIEYEHEAWARLHNGGKEIK